MIWNKKFLASFLTQRKLCAGLIPTSFWKLGRLATRSCCFVEGSYIFQKNLRWFVRTTYVSSTYVVIPFFLFSGMGISSHPVEVEVLIGILTAVTLILLFLFLVVLVYSKRQKFLQSPTSRSGVLNPFPVQINMKELLTASPVLSGGDTTNR